MKRRLTLSLLTVMALLWQGLAAAAFAPGLLAPPAGPATMPEHCRMAGMQARMEAEAVAPAEMAAQSGKPAMKASMKHCCGASSHCACVAACGSVAAVTPTISLLTFAAESAFLPTAPVAGMSAAPPPHPFRPPIRILI